MIFNILCSGQKFFILFIVFKLTKVKLVRKLHKFLCRTRPIPLTTKWKKCLILCGAHNFFILFIVFELKKVKLMQKLHKFLGHTMVTWPQNGGSALWSSIFPAVLTFFLFCSWFWIEKSKISAETINKYTNLTTKWRKCLINFAKKNWFFSKWFLTTWC